MLSRAIAAALKAFTEMLNRFSKENYRAIEGWAAVEQRGVQTIEVCHPALLLRTIAKNFCRPNPLECACVKAVLTRNPV